ncbi:hypothetical protein Daus18300_000028 [Diaporthe australafricana]|uniref:Uncharacterized protein n=1 Tax=Diaporthe australafricana TaxID=127596 RepID=A0ABR3Y7H7_9PEZI
MAQTRAQTSKKSAPKQVGRSSAFTRTGPSALKPGSAIKKKTRNQSKKEPNQSALNISTTAPSEATTDTEARTMAANKAIENLTNGSTLPKEVIVQYTLRITPQPGAKMEEMEEAVRNIESPCKNAIWSSSKMKHTQSNDPKGTPINGSGAARKETLEINLIHNDCGHRTVVPYSCRKNRQEYHAKHWRITPHSEAMKIREILGVVRAMADLVATCEVVARRSWTVNAVSHYGV